MCQHSVKVVALSFFFNKKKKLPLELPATHSTCSLLCEDPVCLCCQMSIAFTSHDGALLIYVAQSGRSLGACWCPSVRLRLVVAFFFLLFPMVPVSAAGVSGISVVERCSIHAELSIFWEVCFAASEVVDLGLDPAPEFVESYPVFSFQHFGAGKSELIVLCLQVSQSI